MIPSRTDISKRTKIISHGLCQDKKNFISYLNHSIFSVNEIIVDIGTNNNAKRSSIAWVLQFIDRDNFDRKKIAVMNIDSFRTLSSNQLLQFLIREAHGKPEHILQKANKLISQVKMMKNKNYNRAKRKAIKKWKEKLNQELLSQSNKS